MPRTLIISDLHNRVDWVEDFIKKINPDFTVFLGDYFDSKNDSKEITAKTAYWLKKSIKHKNRWHLLGNHDLAYFFSQNKHIRITPGFTQYNLETISSILTTEEIDNCFNLVCFIEGYTLSHAGFSPELFDDNPDEKEIARQCDEALLLLKTGQIPKIVNYWPGWNGCQIEGCLMCRWEELGIIYNLKQIVGHSVGKDVKYNFNNVCLDTANKHYGIIENGKLEIYER